MEHALEILIVVANTAFFGSLYLSQQAARNDREEQSRQYSVYAALGRGRNI